MIHSVKQYVKDCKVCQAVNHDNAAKPRLLSPLYVPEEVGIDISMDFITGLPKCMGQEVIFSSCA